jgi:putative flippase GtrA
MIETIARSAAPMRRFSRFIIVGSIGFLVDAGVLWLAIHWAGQGLYSGRAISFLTAATATWYLNRVITYRDREAVGRLSRQWVSYLAVSCLGAMVNYATYCGAVIAMPYAARHPTLGVAVGSIAGLLVNFTLYTTIVFRSSSIATARSGKRRGPSKYWFDGVAR